MSNDWVMLRSGVCRHQLYGRVVLNEDYRRTFRAYPEPDGAVPAITSPSGRPIGFRSREAAMAALVRLHNLKTTT